MLTDHFYRPTSLTLYTWFYPAVPPNVDIIDILSDVFSDLELILLTNVFFRLIDAYIARSHDRNVKPIFISAVHKLVFIVLLLISIAEVTVLIIYTILSRTQCGDNYAYDYSCPISLLLEYYRLGLASAILFMITSLGIMCEIFLFLWRRKALRPLSKVGSVTIQELLCHC